MLRVLAVMACLTAPVSAEALRLGTDGAFPPNVSTGADGTLTGFEPELADTLCPLAGFECNWVVMPFESLEAALLGGDIDAILSGLAVTPERSERMLFTTSYLDISNNLYAVPEGTTPDVKRARVAAQAGTTQAAYVKASGATLVATDTQEAAIAAVRNGTADALFANRSWLNTQDMTGFEPWGEPIQIGRGAAIALRPDATDARDRLNAAFATLAEDGRLEALRRKWFDTPE